MKIVFSNGIFFRNFSYLKRKSHISRQALARLLDVSVDCVKQIEGASEQLAVEYRIVARTAQIFDIDETVLSTIDLESPVRPPCGPPPQN